MSENIGIVLNSYIKYVRSVASSGSRKIKKIIDDIAKKGYSKEKPFAIGTVGDKVRDYARKNGISLRSHSIYVTSRSISHSLRDFKEDIGKSPSYEDLINFPHTKNSMDIYYDGDAFIYTNYTTKFIVKPNYELKIDRKTKKKVCLVTAGVVTDKKEFLNGRYKKI